MDHNSVASAVVDYMSQPQTPQLVHRHQPQQEFSTMPRAAVLPSGARGQKAVIMTSGQGQRYRTFQSSR